MAKRLSFVGTSSTLLVTLTATSNKFEKIFFNQRMALYFARFLIWLNSEALVVRRQNLQNVL